MGPTIDEQMRADFRAFAPEAADEVHPNDWEQVLSAVSNGRPLATAYTAPTGGAADSTWVALKLLYDFLRIASEVPKLYQLLKSAHSKSDLRKELERGIANSLQDLPEDVKARCGRIDLLQMAQNRQL